jgi:mRNA interferase MazF
MQKTRPVVVINADRIGRLPLRLVVPITEWQSQFSIAPWLVRLEPDAGNGLAKTSAADAFQMRSVSLERFVDKVGTLASHDTETIAAAVAVTVDYDPGSGP